MTESRNTSTAPSVHETGLLVLGGGPGGYTAAFRAADLGLQVTLVEERPTLGGVCLNVGCIPSKALLESVKSLEGAGELAERGIVFQAPKVDLDALRAWKDGVVARLAGGLKGLARQRKITVLQGRGVFTGPSSLQLDNGTQVKFAQAIIAVGSRPVQLPFLPDDPRIIDSTGALALPDIPGRLLILGGGIIGMEMATVYAALGSRVTVVEQQDQLMPSCDPELVAPLHKRMQGRLEAVLLKTRVTQVKAEKSGLRVHFEGPQGSSSAVYDRLLVAVGRRPNTDTIGADALGVPVDRQGLITVDAQQRTVNKKVFAIGDIVAGPMLAHKASCEGRVAAEAAAGQKTVNQARVIPQVAYCDPEVAWVGVTEPEAKAQGLAYERSSFPWMANGRATTMGRTEGVTKMLVDPKTHRILGIGMVGPHAGDLIAEAALAMEADLEPGDIALTIHPHPTLSEIMALTAEAYEGTLTELYPPRRK